MGCQFTTIKLRDGRYKHVSKCGVKAFTTSPAYWRECGCGAVPSPSLPIKTEPPRQARRLLNFTVAAIQHFRAGMPTCTQEEIDARIAVCHGCELYKPSADNPDVGHCRHKSCGCGITREARFVSKLAWRDQKCPLGKWPELTAAP
jgi:hypothetical protein